MKLPINTIEKPISRLLLWGVGAVLLLHLTIWTFYEAALFCANALPWAAAVG